MSKANSAPIDRLLADALIAGVDPREAILQAAARIIESYRHMKHTRNADILVRALKVASGKSPSGTPEPIGDVDLVPIHAETWRRVKAATGYGSFECDAHVADAIEGLLKETRLAMPYANALEDFTCEIATILGIQLGDEVDPERAWRVLLANLRAGITTARQALGLAPETSGAELFSEVYRFAGDRNLLKRDVEDLTVSLEQATAEKSSLAQEKAKLEGHLERVGKMVGALEEFLHDQTEERVGQLVADLTQAREVATQALHDAASLEDELEVHKGAIDGYRAEIARLEALVRDRVVDADASPAPTGDLDFNPIPEELRAGEPAKEIVVEEFEPMAPNGEVKTEGGQPADNAPEPPPAVLMANPPVPDDYPGRQGPVKRVSMSDMARGLQVTDGGAIVPKEPKTTAAVRPTVDQRLGVLSRIANGEEDRGEIAKAVGLPNGRHIQGILVAHRVDLGRLRQAPPDQRGKILDEIRSRLSRVVASA